MIKSFENAQATTHTSAEAAMGMLGEMGKNWQAVVAEMADYTRRSFDDNSQTVQKLMTARSVEQAMEIQTAYAKRAYDDYLHQMTKISGLCAGIAKDALRPMEKAFLGGR